MYQLPSLKITDRFECRFLLFDSLNKLWAFCNADLLSEKSKPEPLAASGKRNRALSESKNHIESEDCIVIVDGNVMMYHRDKLETIFPPETSRYFEVPPGESSKSIDMWRKIIDFIFSGSVRRNTPVISVGGGVTGDLAGFAAATMMRGLPLIQVPTTLLAMVDSAIGGKTGINHNYGKNTIGAFYHPDSVLFDTEFLETLPQREWLCGISEVLKYGYINDPELLDQATRLADPGSREIKLLQNVILKSVRIKSGIVAEDSRESGNRAWLNFGHTFAHALETLDGYRNINHGEAVYAGMIAALYISKQFGAAVSDQSLVDLKEIYQLDINAYHNNIDELISLMAHDKKNRDHKIRLVLLDDYGQPRLDQTEDSRLLIDSWQYVFHILKK